MFRLAFAIPLPFYFLIYNVIADDYCRLNCSDAIPHTACARRPPCDIAPACSKRARLLATTREMRAWFLQRHNTHRNKVARGGVRFRGGTVKSANMRKLRWDDELAYTARCWAAACEAGHDSCRLTERFPVQVGQNRFDRVVGVDENIDERAEVYKAVDNWYNEARHLNESLIVRYEVAVAPHGAQVLWARTTHIGCARIEYFIDEEEKKKRLTTICNYGPGGNIAGSAVFLIGEPCSRCGRKICCDEEYDALCMDNNSGERFIHAKSLLVIFIIFIQSL